MEIKNFLMDCWKKGAKRCIIIHVIRKHAAYYRKIKIGEMIMSKLKKKAFAVILGGALSVMSCLPVFAAEPGISPHVESTICGQCRIGTVHRYRTEKYLYDEREDGVLKYKVYQVTITNECNNCTYRNTDTYLDKRRP